MCGIVWASCVKGSLHVERTERNYQVACHPVAQEVLQNVADGLKSVLLRASLWPNAVLTCCHVAVQALHQVMAQARGSCAGPLR